ncbi:MAG: type VI secretion system tip protein TssI/VgrG [bacterium]|nr:type VI secretion system tip protein TssI/VgrG [bacterium]
MPVIRSSSEADFTFEAQDYSGELRVVSLSGSEDMSELFRFDLELASEDAEIDFETIVGKPALLTIHGEEGERYVSGIVSRFEQNAVGTRFTQYSAELVPVIWLLSYRYKCRIFQEKTVEEIITQVLQEAGIPADRFRFSLQGQYQPREYCVQYQESELSFISRLMEEEGIFYFFEHTDSGHVLVMADSSSVHVPIESPDTVIFHEPRGGVSSEEHISEWSYSEEVRPGAVMLRDFNFQQPTMDLQKTADAGRDTALEIYHYPGEYQTAEAGQNLADVQLEEFQAARQIGAGSSVCRRFLPGFRFTLDQHPRSSFNQEYLLTSVSHTGSQPQVLEEEAVGGTGTVYENQFGVIPYSTPYRPPRTTPKPTVQGTQTAIVVGPGGEEIYTDEHGRVKVQFHWDREGQNDENSSCWIRVSQLWAGANWGAMWIPRIGHEVIVDFLEGDPDRPIITGRVYHGDNRPPYPLPDEKTKSTIKSDSSLGGGGSNELRFEDKKGSEEVYIHAQKDKTVKVENNRSTSVGASDSLSVGGDRSKTVDKNETNTIKGDRTEDVTGKETITIKGGREETVSQGEKITITSGRTEEVTGEEKITITGKRTEKVTSGEDITITGGRTEKVTGGEQITITSGGQKVNIIGDTTHTITGNLGISSSADITLKADGVWESKGGKQGKLSAPKVQIKGDTEVQIECGGSLIKLEAAKITLSSGSGQIILDPSGTTIVGAMVKIN